VARSAAFFGAKGLILHNPEGAPAARLSPVAIKSASGGLDALPIHSVSNLGGFVRALRRAYDDPALQAAVAADADVTARRVDRATGALRRDWGGVCVVALAPHARRAVGIEHVDFHAIADSARARKAATLASADSTAAASAAASDKNGSEADDGDVNVFTTDILAASTPETRAALALAQPSRSFGVVLLLGAEGSGLPADVISDAHVIASIKPLLPQRQHLLLERPLIDSVNVAAAAAVALQQVMRARTASPIAIAAKQAAMRAKAKAKAVAAAASAEAK